MNITKTDFIHFLNCPKSFWVLKKEPERYPEGKFSKFVQKIIREGYEVENYAEKYFYAEKRDVTFQRILETREGLYSRSDVIEKTSTGQTILYEVKSSTKIKTEHLKDACFQVICAERAGQNIDRVFIIHLNGNYKKKGPINPTDLLTFVDVTETVAQLHSETAKEVEKALELLNEDEIYFNGCPCIFKSRAHHCDTFSLFNPEIPVNSIYSLPRLSGKIRTELVSNGIFDLRNVKNNYHLSETQKLVVQSAKSGNPCINKSAIRSFLSNLSFPLYFIDYETFSSAIPIIDGTSPYRQIPVQYSLHILEKNGSLNHSEFLECQARMPINLLEKLKEDIKKNGNLVSWHASFEKSRNRELAEDIPEYSEFLNDLNSRTVDLEDIFKTSYVDVNFDGSTSIKKVLPILCPQLSYSNLNVQDGASAIEAWERMINSEPEQADKIAHSLLKYCKLDTLAMVEIYRFLASI